MNSRGIPKRWSTDQLITGIETREWLGVLRDNGVRVDPAYAHRLAWISGLSLPTTLVGRLEDARYGRQLASMDIDPAPVFVLGHWRSGTTHLHNLLGRVPDHTFPTVLQVVLPTAFMSADPILPKLTSRLMDATRSYDAVKHGWHEAAEDEIALAKLTGMSPYVGMMFPDNAAKYEKYLDFQEATDDERKRWLEALRYFLKKIMIHSGGRRVVLKSCAHTARVRLLLDAFPDARFVLIHRHPYEVFASMLHMRSHTDWENFFRLPEMDPDVDRRRQTLILGQRLFEQYATDRHLIPDDRLVEIAYGDLVGHELSFVERIFAQLDLGDWPTARRALEPYVRGLVGYRRNNLRLERRDREDVDRMWHAAFELWGYEPGAKATETA